MSDDDKRTAARLRVERLISDWPLVPAFLIDEHLNIVLSNKLARAVLPAFSPGFNLAKFTFLDSSAAHSSRQWQQMAADVAAVLRDSLGRNGEDPQFLSLVGELAARSDAFAQAWAREDGSAPNGSFSFLTAAVGTLRLEYHQLLLPENPLDVLVVWRPADSASKAGLAELADTASGAETDS